MEEERKKKQAVHALHKVRETKDSKMNFSAPTRKAPKVEKQNFTKEQQDFMAKKQAAKKEDRSGDFDLRSRITNAEGEVEQQQDYFIYIEGGQKYFERPLGSGNLFYANGESAGRVEKDENKKNSFDTQAEHKDFKAPADPNAEAEEKLKHSQAELAAMKKELSAIKAEKEQAEKAQKLTAEAKAKAQDKKDEK